MADPCPLHSENPKEGIDNSRIQLWASWVQHCNVHFVPRQEQELTTFNLLKPTQLKKLNPAF